jgi:hypothetical protein
LRAFRNHRKAHRRKSLHGRIVRALAHRTQTKMRRDPLLPSSRTIMRSRSTPDAVVDWSQTFLILQQFANRHVPSA